MTKRTNKTDHVLNLLGGASKNQDEHEEKVTNKDKRQPPVDPFRQQNSSVSVMHTSTSEEDPIAGSIRSTLEKELQGVQPVEKPVKAPEVEPVMESVREPEVEPVMESVREPEVEPVKEPVMESVREPEVEPVMESVREPEVEPVMEPVQVQEEQELKIESVEVKETPAKDLSTKLADELAKKEAEQERNFEFVNVMERLVRDKVKGYMKQFGNCTCDRCVEDTVALALTNLPPKCVVVNKAAVSPLLNFYTSKYAGHITVEITKACMVVNDNPCH